MLFNVQYINPDSFGIYKNKFKKFMLGTLAFPKDYYPCT